MDEHSAKECDSLYIYLLQMMALQSLAVMMFPQSSSVRQKAF